MKKLSYLMLFFLSAFLLGGCADTEQPYVGYITIKRAVVEAAANSTATITADTDIDSPIELKSIDFGEGVEEWCTVAFNGRDITVTATQANTGDNYRTATVNVKCGYWQTSFTVLQKYEGQEYLQYDWTGWTATGSDVQENDGGGYSSLFTEDRTEFWHSYYGEPTPCPHWLLIDMQKELECSRFAIGRREAGGNNYPSVKHMNIYTSTDGENFEQVGEFTFELPWTAPDGTVVEGNSPLVPAEEVITLDAPVTARYIKLEITATNNDTGVCQVAYCKVYEKL